MCFFNKGSAPWLPEAHRARRTALLRTSASSCASTLKPHRHRYSGQFVFKGEHSGVSWEGEEMVLKGADVKRWD